jgi:hypothetical protein
MHAIVGGQVVKTWPLPIPADQRAALAGARAAVTPAPPPPTGPLQATRRVPNDGITMVAKHRLRIGRTHAGKQVTILIEDTHFRVMHGDQELSLHPRNPDIPIRNFHAGHAPHPAQER